MFATKFSYFLNKSKNYIAIFCSFVILFLSPIDVNAASINVAYNESKTAETIVQCPGYYTNWWVTSWPSLSYETLFAQGNHTYGDCTTDLGSGHYYCFSGHKLNVGMNDKGAVQNSGTSKADNVCFTCSKYLNAKNASGWFSVTWRMKCCYRHHGGKDNSDYIHGAVQEQGGRDGARKSACAVCGSTKLSKDTVYTDLGCTNNANGSKRHMWHLRNNVLRCGNCGKSYDAKMFEGKCTEQKSGVGKLSIQTIVSGKNSENLDFSKTLTGNKADPIVIKYNSSANLQMKFTSSNEAYATVRGFKVIQKGAGFGENGVVLLDVARNENLCFEGFDIETKNITNVSTLEVVLYTSFGNETENWKLPVITIVPYFHYLVYDLNGGSWGTTSTHPDMAIWNNDTYISNPSRDGFRFIGWRITGMDAPNDGNGGDKHYWGTSKTNYTTTWTKTAANESYSKYGVDTNYVPAGTVYFKNLRNRNVGYTVKLEAIWMDDSNPTLENDYPKDPGEPNNRITYRNVVDGSNNDSALKVSSRSSYNITTYTSANLVSKGLSGSVNWKTATDAQLARSVTETMSNRYANYIQFVGTPVTYQTYPNYFGTTADKSRYYPGTWTNKTVEIIANAYDGSSSTKPKNNGGSGFKYNIWFDNDNLKETGYALTKNSNVTAKKTFTNTGIYSGKVTVKDRASMASNTAGNKWIANPKGDLVTTINYGQIKIDKTKPVVMNPWTLDTSTKAFRDAMYMMYEGYNDIRGENDLYGWAMDNVKVVIYATDEHSGIAAQAFCWNKDPNVASNWQSADETRVYNGKTIPVSTRVVTRKESGYVYVRDAVGNWTRIDYNVDHLDKQTPDVYPDKDPDTPPKDPAVPPDPLNPDDPDVDPYKPRPNGPYNFDSTDSTNELKYDWINHDGTLIFDAKDYGVSNTNSKGDNGDKYGSSGIWKMTLYRSNQNFPTVTETLSNGRTRQRANTNLYGSETVAEEVVFGNQITYVEHREGISYFILEVLDKANNLTSVKLTVKIDKTYPGIPHVLNPSESSALGIQNGGAVNGNDIISNFGSGKYWTIDQADLNKAAYNNVEAYIQNEDNIKCYLEFIIYDENWTGEYAYGSNRSRDNSGFDEIKLKLIDADNLASNKTYIFYDYSKPAKEGKDTLGRAFTKNMTEYALSSENSVAYFYGDLTRETLVSTHFVAKINTFKDFPNASALNYEIEISDRAGNVKTYRNEPGNEIRNFSIKAVMNSAENQTFNVETLWKMEAIIDNDTDVEKSVYVYENRLGEQYRSSYELTPAEKAEKGLNFVRMTTETVSVSTTVESGITAMTNVPYYQLGDMGFVDIWTVGYVPKVQFNFNTGGDPIGGEMVEEIRQGKIPAKYNLGVYGGAYDTTKHRIVPYTSGNKVNVTYASDVGGVPFSMHYGVKERNDFVSPVIDTQRGWLENGTSIRMPIYYELTEDGGNSSDGKPTYHAELHKASFIAIKGNWKDFSTASYIIYDTRQNDIHHRVTHES